MFQSGQIAAPLIMILTIGISLVGLFWMPRVVDSCLLRPYYLLRDKQYDTIILSGFVHGDMSHLLFNMFTFFFFALPMERIIGTIPFLILYFSGLVLSNTCTWFKHRNETRYASLGASGAISAVLFAYIVYQPTSSIIIFPIPIPIPAFLFAIGYVAYSYWASSQNTGRINHDAHLCGALSGLAFVAITDPAAYQHLVQSL
jgi:membrane associated rhomboid family serine protease